jgi:hypothetical protein
MDVYGLKPQVAQHVPGSGPWRPVDCYGALWTPANGSDLLPEQKAAGSNPAGGTALTSAYAAR